MIWFVAAWGLLCVYLILRPILRPTGWQPLGEGEPRRDTPGLPAVRPVASASTSEEPDASPSPNGCGYTTVTPTMLIGPADAVVSIVDHEDALL